MCCHIDLNSKQDARHFLGKDEPDLLPKSCDNVSHLTYTGTPAMSAWDKLVAYVRSRKSTQIS